MESVTPVWPSSLDAPATNRSAPSSHEPWCPQKVSLSSGMQPTKMARQVPTTVGSRKSAFLRQRGARVEGRWGGCTSAPVHGCKLMRAWGLRPGGARAGIGRCAAPQHEGGAAPGLAWRRARGRARRRNGRWAGRGL